MPEINYIKHLRQNEDLKISEIVKKTGYNWRTVKKYADGAVPTEPIQSTSKGMMYTEGYGEIVDDWLEEDSKLPAKDRRNNKKIHQMLMEDHRFKGSYRTVCNYIRLRKPQLKNQKVDRYERLEHPPGEAQVDFGKMTAVQDGAYKDINSLVLSFPYSNAGFVYPMPSENAECFLEGLKRLFEQAGGVPTHLRIDNLAAAVISIGKGDRRKYTDSFLRFQAQFGFETQPCNPAAGYEKGHVEKKVGYTRSNYFTVAPIMTDYEQLAQWTSEEMIKDRQRVHYAKEVLIESLWQEERSYLRKLPEDDLDIYTVDSSVVTKYGEIKVDGTQFLIRKAHPKQTILIKKKWDTFICFTEEGEIVYKDFRPYMGKSRPIPWGEILEDWQKKPRSVTYSRFFKYLPDRVQTYLIKHKEEMRKYVTGVREFVKTYGFEQLNDVLEGENRYSQTPHELKFIWETMILVEDGKTQDLHTPKILQNYQTNLDSYDAVLVPSLGGVK